MDTSKMLTAYCMKTKEKNVPMQDCVISKTARGGYMAQGTDGKGTDAYNDALSLRRAESVRVWLIRTGGIPDAAITAEGRGKREPIAPNTLPSGADNPQGRAQNRRVELIARPA